MTNPLVQKRRNLNSLEALVRSGLLLPITPTTDTGYRTYGQGRLFLPAGTNYLTNPSFETESGTAGLAAGISEYKTVGGTPVYSLVPGRNGGLAQRMQYTASADTTKALQIYFTTAAGSVSAGDVVTSSGYLKVAITGTPAVNLQTQWSAGGASPTVALTNCTEWTRFSVSGTAPATNSFAYLVLNVSHIDTGDAVDIVWDDACLTKSAVLEPYFSGPQTWDSMSGCAWSGTANASTSTRTASSLIYALSGFPAQPGNTTLAARLSPLYGVNGAGSKDWLATLTSADSRAVYFGCAANAVYCYSVSTPQIQGGAPAAASVNSIIYRSSSTTQDLHDGTSRAQAAINATAKAQDKLVVGGASGAAAAYIGPAVISPTRWTDADVTNFQANQAALWSDPVALVNWLRGHGYTGSLVLPLQSDSVGYVVS